VKIEVENSAPLVDFKSVRDQLIQNEQRFSPSSLSQVPYEQLHLCATGEAKAARCSRDLVVEERRLRRARFLNMETDELEASQTFLQINQMDEDVQTAQATRNAPKWEDLNARQQVWAKLNCIQTHIDDPSLRLKEAIILLRECATQQVLPPEVAMSFMPRLRGLLTVYPGKIEDDLFRAKISEIADALFEFLDEREALVLQKEEIQNYSCTSDCYRVIV
jgi:hypothetical protein